ncbi:hypothetical protein TIFTF001_035779 [Ficus carica]|uniref:Uncharacterized protein n=1 Tax=Ficus carica TaxID=3494 RepID=A0AA88E256_FICCA|nr:hypothetical protein TIFTF001_035779 [Ficus carica]
MVGGEDKYLIEIIGSKVLHGLSLEVTHICFSLYVWLPAKGKQLEVMGTPVGVSATGTPMFKSVMALVSKQRGRALIRKSCSYLNRWADPLFISVPRELGCSGDPVGLNSECPRRVVMLQASIDTGGGHGVNLTRRHRPAPSARAGARTGPMVCSVSGARRRWAVCYVMAPKVISSWSARGGAVHRRWWSFNHVLGEGFLTGLIWSGRLYTAIDLFPLALKMSLHVFAQPVHCEMVGFHRRINCTINRSSPSTSRMIIPGVFTDVR